MKKAKNLTGAVKGEVSREVGKELARENKGGRRAEKRKAKLGAGTASLLAVLCALFVGCQSTPNRAQTLTFEKCGINVYAGYCPSNAVAAAEGILPDIAVGRQTMAVENSGTESLAPVQTVDTKPEIAVGVGGGSAGTGGASPSSGLTEAARAAFNKLASGEKITAEEAAALKGCADGNCERQ